MKKITLLIALLFTYSAFLLNAQTSIWNEDFDDNTQYNVTLGAEGNDGTADYFQRTDGSNINKTYTGKIGTYFFAGQDIDDTGWPGSANPSELTWTSISSISSYTSLQFKGYFASTATAKIDDNDYLHVQYRIDAGSWTDLIWFENDGTQYNTYFLEDTDFDGTGDGTQLTGTFVQFTKDITGTGSTLELRFTAAANSGDEDFAIDYFEVLGTAPGGVDNPTDFVSTTADADQIDLSWTENANSDAVLVAINTTAITGAPVDGTTYTDGDLLSDGSEVIYNGTAEMHNETSLTSDTRYYFAAWSVDGSINYSSGISADTTTYASEPTTDATSPTATANSTSEITVGWTDGTKVPGNYLIKGSDVGYGSITDPADGSPEANGTLVQNVAAGNGSFQFTDLTPSTTYYFKIYPYNGDNGSINYKTNTPAQTSTATQDPTGASAGDIVITEVIQNPNDVSDTYGEWFEVFNTTASDIDIEGWVISDAGTESHTINNGGALNVPAGGFLILGRDDGSVNNNGGAPVDYQYADIFLGNSDDELILTSDESVEIDRIEWDGGPNWPDPTGASMTYIGFASEDNNVGSKWITAVVRENNYTNPLTTETDFGSPKSNGLFQNIITTTTWTGIGNWSEGNGVGNSNWSNGSPGSQVDVTIDGSCSC